MVKFGFVVESAGGNSNYYSGNVKPFTDLSFGLKNIGFDSIIFLHRDENHLMEKIKKVTRDSVPIVLYDQGDLFEIITKESPDFVIVQDTVPMMRIITRLKAPRVKKVVYVLYLSLLDSNTEQWRERSIVYKFASLLPFRILTNEYRSLISGFDFIIPISQTCRFLLNMVYDLKSDGVVYPPVGVDIRDLMQPLSNGRSKKEGIFAFVPDINDYLLRDPRVELENIRSQLQCPVRVLTGERTTTKLFSDLGYETYSKIPVEELVRIIQDSEFSYVTTRYELFGYVAVESLLLGRPAILDTFHPSLELLPMGTNAIKISSPKRSIADHILEMRKSNINIGAARDAVLKYYSAEESARALLESVNISINLRDR